MIISMIFDKESQYLSYVNQNMYVWEFTIILTTRILNSSQNMIMWISLFANTSYIIINYKEAVHLCHKLN